MDTDLEISWFVGEIFTLGGIFPLGLLLSIKGGGGGGRGEKGKGGRGVSGILSLVT